MLPKARICHTLPGRIRLQIPEQRHNKCYFQRIEHSIGQLDDIRHTKSNPSAASVLIYHGLGNDEALQRLQRMKLFDISRSPCRQADFVQLTEQALGALRRIDQSLKEITHGNIDFWGFLFAMFTGMGAIQTVKGNISSPASTFYWYALGALVFARTNELLNLPGSGGTQPTQQTAREVGVLG